MKVLKKCASRSFVGFDWLEFDYLPDSHAFRFELDFEDSKDVVLKSMAVFHLFFDDVLNDMLVKPFGLDGKWGDFCLDTWNPEYDEYDYSPENKQEPTASYLEMLRDSGIEAEYSGFCQCLDWDRFLYVTLHCVMQHVAPYSMLFYVCSQELVFYFHHTGSLGIYYKNLNSKVKRIIKQIQIEDLKIKGINDERVVSLMI